LPELRKSFYIRPNKTKAASLRVNRNASGPKPVSQPEQHFSPELGPALPK
jgi:hypothetical protein